MDRLDHYLTKMWSKVEEGDLKAIGVALRISDARTARTGLLGLDHRTVFAVVGALGPPLLRRSRFTACWRSGRDRL
jgi:hypothetical protein